MVVPMEYSQSIPRDLRFQYCPMCAAQLTAVKDRDGESRPACPSCGWTHYPRNVMGVCLLITTPGGIVFLFPPGESSAELPGGIVECGESPEEAAVREALEETGLHVAVERLLGWHFWPDHPYGPVVDFLFEARMTGGVLRDGPEGSVKAFPIENLPQISSRDKTTQKALEIYLSERRRHRKI